MDIDLSLMHTGNIRSLAVALEKEKLRVENSQVYRPGVEMLLLKQKWTFNVRTPESFGRPVDYFLEQHVGNGVFERVNLDAPVKGRKKKKNATGEVKPLFDLSKIHVQDDGTYILPISSIKEGTTEPFLWTSFSKRPSPKHPAPEADIFLTSVENGKRETLKGSLLIICNNNIKDLASMHPSDRDRIEAALENLVYFASLTWKVLKDLQIKNVEIYDGFQLNQDRFNTNLENDIVKLYYHRGLLENAIEDSIRFKFGEKHGDENVRLKAVRDLVRESAHGSDLEKVVRGVFFVFQEQISFCCTTDNKETKDVLFSYLDDLPTNVHEPRCEIPLQAVIDCVNEGLFTIMPLQKDSNKRRPGGCVRQFHISEVPSESDLLGLFLTENRSPRYRDEEEDENEEQSSYKRLCTYKQ